MSRLIVAGILVAILPIGAQAESVSRTLDGTQLQLKLSCVDTVSIEPDAALSGKVDVMAEADSAEELKRLEMTGGGAVKIQRKGDCNGGDHRATLTLSIKVPPAMPIELHGAGSGDYRIGAVGGPLKLEMAGSGDVEAQRSADLDLTMAGSGDVSLDQLDGPGKIEMRGSGDVKIGQVTAPGMQIAARGSGDVEIGDGTIGTLKVSVAGSGDVKIGATVTADADLSSFGSADISVAKATGKIEQNKKGSGEIKIGE